MWHYNISLCHLMQRRLLNPLTMLSLPLCVAAVGTVVRRYGCRAIADGPG